MNKLYNNRIIKQFFIFQPIIDIITSLMLNKYSFSISVGIIIRSLFMIYAIIYILKNSNKFVKAYIVCGVIYVITNIIGHTINIDDFNIYSHISFIVHLVYFPIVLLFFYIYYKNNKEIDDDIFLNMGIIIGLSVIVSIITNTYNCSYDAATSCYKRGIIGWFNSANEYSLISTAILGYSLSSYFKKIRIKSIITIIIMSLFLVMIGTKTGYIGVLVMTGGISLYYLIGAIFNKKLRVNLKVLILPILIFVSVIISTKKLPIYYNLVERFNFTVTNIQESAPAVSEEVIVQEVKKELIFNGRVDFVNYNKMLYKEANLFDKFFGITMQGNYIDGILYTHISEQDLYDLVIYYGIIGAILVLILPIYMLYKIIKKVISNIKILKDVNFIICALLLAYTLFISFMAGHCMLQPSVSIYLSYLFISIYKRGNVYE